MINSRKHSLPDLTAQKGFTIVELMIATTILSVILVLVTAVMISIGNLFYKGINQTRVQDNVRSITDELSQHLQLNGTPTPGSATYNNVTVYAFCFDTIKYSYVIGAQIGSSNIKHVLWRNDYNSGNCTPSDLTDPNLSTSEPNGVELIAPSSRLTALNITGTGTYDLVVGVAYGDNDLLCDTGTANDCDATSPSSTHVWNPTAPSSGLNITCKGQTGDNFCSTTHLTATVVQRVN